jgi:hypothetical protein
LIQPGTKWCSPIARRTSSPPKRTDAHVRERMGPMRYSTRGGGHRRRSRGEQRTSGHPLQTNQLLQRPHGARPPTSLGRMPWHKLFRAVRLGPDAKRIAGPITITPDIAGHGHPMRTLCRKATPETQEISSRAGISVLANEIAGQRRTTRTHDPLGTMAIRTPSQPIQSRPTLWPLASW